MITYRAPKLSGRKAIFALYKGTMSFRPPRAQSDPFESVLDHEMRSEAASTHGRMLAKFNKALTKLAATPRDDLNYSARVEAAGEALWYLVIQRDIMGFRNTNALLDEMEVPPAVRLAMGVRKKKIPID